MTTEVGEQFWRRLPSSRAKDKMIHPWAGIIKTQSLHQRLGQEVTTFAWEAVKSCFNKAHKNKQPEQEQILTSFSKTRCWNRNARVRVWMQL